MSRIIIALLSGTVVWLIFYGLGILMPTFILYLFLLGAIGSGFASATIASDRKYIIAIISVLIGYLPTAIWSFTIGPVGKNLSFRAVIISLIIGSFIVSNMAVVGAFLSKLFSIRKYDPS